jgi:pyrimidine deaminase RibD-like protein
MSAMEARRRGIRYHYDLLLALKEGFDDLSHGVVRANRYEMFRAVVEDTIDELGDVLPQFQERYFFVRTSEGDFYDVEALRAYLGMALAVLQRGLSQEFSDFDMAMMKLAIEEARKCVPEDTRVHPRVGVVVTKGQTLLASAYRGQTSPGEHAEYTVLERMLSDVAVAGATIYTTLEPCTTRNPPKIPCADRLIDRKVARVIIGMLDPDRRIRGNGFTGLRAANIGVGVFPDNLKAEIEELNREFIRSVAAPPVHYARQGQATPYSGSSYVLVLFPEAREVFIDDHSQGNNLAASGRPRALVVGAGVHTFRLGGAPDVEPATQILDVPDRPILNPFSVVFQKV